MDIKNKQEKISQLTLCSMPPDINEVLDTLNHVSNNLISDDSQDFIQIIPETVCKLLSAPVCILWKFDEEDNKFRAISCSEKVDEEYKRFELNLSEKVILLFAKNDVLPLVDINNCSPALVDVDELRKRKWFSLLSAPLKINNKVIGILNVHSGKADIFSDWQKKALKKLANYTVLSFQKNEISIDREKLQTLANTMLKMTEASEANELWKLLREGALELVGSKQVWVAKLDYHTGEIKTVVPKIPLYDNVKIYYGKGITGKALALEKPINIGDLSKSELKKDYIQIEENSRSELAIPILIENIPIREKKDVKQGSKIIGALNVESSNPYAFSDLDEKRLWLLCRYAASRFERLEQDSKLHKLREFEKELTENKQTKPKTYEEMFSLVVKGITETLGFEWVNISLIDQEKTQIRSAYVVSIGWEHLTFAISMNTQTKN